jgi:superfamily II DNA or RNA helicase
MGETPSNQLFENLYTHQKTCVNKIEEHFQSENTKGLVKMFCGTGKSLIQHYLLSQNQKTLLVVPSIALTAQFVEQYIIKRGFSHPFITICSKNEINSSEKDNINIEVTTTVKDIKLFFKTNKSSFFVCCTYQSLVKLLKCVNFKFDLCILDEAHRSLGKLVQTLIFDKKQDDEDDDYDDENSEDEDENENSDEEDIDTHNDIKKIDPKTKPIGELSKKILFFTATPKNANGINMTGSKSDCGDLIFDYSLRQGVEDNVLMDYEICINISKQTPNLDRKTRVFEAISRNALTTDNYKVMLFHALANESDKKKDSSSVKEYISDKTIFKDKFYRVLETEFPEKAVSGFKYEGIISETESQKRKKILETEFGKDKNCFYAVSSCRTLGEGIDTKCCNHVCWVDTKQSFVEIIQNIGRCSRKKEAWGTPSVEKSTITIPIMIDASLYGSCDTAEQRDKVIREDMQNSENWSPIFNVLSALKQNDPEYYELCLRYPKKFCKKDYERHNKLTKRGQVEVEVDSEDKDNDEENEVVETPKTDSTEKKIEDYANALDTPVELYTNSMEEPMKLIGEDKGGEVQKIYGNDETGEIFDMEEKEKGNGIQIPKRKKTNIRVQVDPEIQVLWNIRDGCDFTKDVVTAFLDCQVVDKEEKWMENYNRIIVNKKLSHWRTKQGAWENTQRLKFNSGTLLQNRIELLNQINFWKWCLNNDDDVFEEKRIQYENFYIKNQKIPSQSSTNDEEKTLAQWRSDQIKIYKCKSKVKPNEDRIKKLNNTKGWYWDIWYYNFDKYCEYINENKKRPAREHKLGAWENTQRLAYHGKVKNDLDNNKISKLESFPGWKWELETKEDKWFTQYNRSKLFTIENQRLAQIIKSPKNQKEKLETKIADWNNLQRRKKRNGDRGKLTKEQIKLLNEIPGWYWEKSQKTKASPISSPINNEINDLSDQDHLNIKLEEHGSLIVFKDINPDPTSLSKLENTTQETDWENIILVRTKPKKKSIPSPQKANPRSYLRPIPNPQHEKLTTSSFSTSALSTFHKKFKTLHSSTYFSHIQSNPDEFKEYYKLAKEAEENDNPEDKPLNVLSNQLNQLPPNLKIADLGCGDATLSTLCPKHKFTNIDAYGLNDKVEVHNITQLPEEYSNHFDIVVLSRAMWASNKKDVLIEAKRILNANGRIFICEPFKRWNWNKEQNEFGENRLDKLLNDTGFSIQSELNTEVQNGSYPKFMYYECMKRKNWKKQID